MADNEEEINFDMKFVPSFESILEQYMEKYGTESNYQRTYGGEIKPDKEEKMNHAGEVTIKFSRPVIFPNELIKEYDSDYVETVPILTITEAEKKELKKIYDEDVANISEQIEKEEENAGNELKTEDEPSKTESDSTSASSISVSDCESE